MQRMRQFQAIQQRAQFFQGLFAQLAIAMDIAVFYNDVNLSGRLQIKDAAGRHQSTEVGQLVGLQPLNRRGLAAQISLYL